MKWEYLNPADRPVVDGLEKHEVIYAEHQPEYIPLRCLRSNTQQREVLSRWTLTPEQRQMIAEGADVFLSLWTFGESLQPIQLAISADPEPWFFQQRMKLQLACGCFGTCKGHTEGSRPADNRDDLPPQPDRFHA